MFRQLPEVPVAEVITAALFVGENSGWVIYEFRHDFSLPPALNARLSTLLDQQDDSGDLDDSQRSEAEALCETVDMLALLKLRAERAAGRNE